MSRRNFCEKTCVWQKFLLSILGHWANTFQNFVRFCSAGPSTKQPMCLEVLCDEKKMSQRKVFFLKMFSDFWQSCFQQDCHRSILFCRGRFKGSFSRIFFSFFLKLAAKTRLLKKHQVECENFIVRVRRNFLRKKHTF